MSFKFSNWFRSRSSKDATTNTLEGNEPNPTASTGIRLIVGLGNPGPQYQFTRHNVGERWARNLAQANGVQLKPKRKFLGLTGTATISGETVQVLIPTTYMNRSGQSVRVMTRLLDISANQILVAHDEVAFPSGVTKLKEGGGLNGHHGLESIVECLGGNKDFFRLRLGVGHPGQAHLVSKYLTQEQMTGDEWQQIRNGSKLSEETLNALIQGDTQRAMWLLHTENSS